MKYTLLSTIIAVVLLLGVIVVVAYTRPTAQLPTANIPPEL